MRGYYDKTLSAQRLKLCYEIAPPRVQQYLEAEIQHVLQHIRTGDRVLELGCGYGRILMRLAQKAGLVIGIDTSIESLSFGQQMFKSLSNCSLLNMDAMNLGFRKQTFDCVVCIQNGISAFHVDKRKLIRESVRVTKSGGIVLYSSYAEKFWDSRLEWFERQSKAGFLGEIDIRKTGNGVVVCKDGFIATTVTPSQFRSLVTGLSADVTIVEVDESSLFCEVTPH
jgi:2-polyprenyl-6-hydroxyphenyl methylase/3-demethylubiquinone-9 3-methyltransferase